MVEHGGGRHVPRRLRRPRVGKAHAHPFRRLDRHRGRTLRCGSVAGLADAEPSPVSPMRRRGPVRSWTMFSNLSAGALGLSLDYTTAIDHAAKHGFGGVDPDLGHFRSLGSPSAVAEHADSIRERGLQWGMAGLPVPLDGPAETFRSALADLPDHLELLHAAG